MSVVESEVKDQVEEMKIEEPVEGAEATQDAQAAKKKKGQWRYTNQQNVNGDLKVTTVYAKKEEEDDVSN